MKTLLTAIVLVVLLAAPASASNNGWNPFPTTDAGPVYVQAYKSHEETCDWRGRIFNLVCSDGSGGAPGAGDSDSDGGGQ